MRRLISMVLAVMMIVTNLGGVVFADGDNSGEAAIKSITLEDSKTGYTLRDTNRKMIVKGIDEKGNAKNIANTGVKFEVTNLGENTAISIAEDGTVTPITGGVSLVKATYTDGTNGDLTASIIMTVGAKNYENGFDTAESVDLPATFPMKAVAMQDSKGTTKLDTDTKHSGDGSMYLKSYYGTNLDTYSDITKANGEKVTQEDVAELSSSRWMRINLLTTEELPEHGVVELWFKDEFSGNPAESGVYFQTNGENTLKAINGQIRISSGNYFWYNDPKTVSVTKKNNIKRTEGWHQLIVDYSGEHNGYIYIDGNLLMKREGDTLVNAVAYVCFQRCTAAKAKNSAWIDDLTVYNTAATSLDPEKVKVKIEGTTLKGSYKFADNTADGSITESASEYRYIRYDSKDAAEGTVVKSGTCTDKDVPGYEITIDDLGKVFAFEVTAKGGNKTGSTVISSRIDGPAAPTASEVSVNGRTIPDSEVTGTYTYADIDGDEEAGTTFRWLYSDTKDGEFKAIEGATSTTFKITKELDGKYIKFEVTPKNTAFGGNNAVAALSDAMYVNNIPPVASDVKIKGGAYTGSVLTSDYTYTDDDEDKEGTSKFQWYACDTENGTFTAISNATGSQLGVSDDLGGKYVLVEVTPVDALGKAGTAVKSAPVLIKKSDSDSKNSISAFYVATDGNDANDGTLDKPFATLKAARDAIRVMKTAGNYPASGVTVYIKGGTYVFNETLEFDEQDSGEEYAPVTYRPYNNEKVTLTGGKILDYSKFKAVDGDMKNYLVDETAKTNVKVANVKDLGIDPADIADYTLDYTQRREMLYRFTMEMDGQYMPLSKYPNSISKADWISTKETSESVITCADSRLKNWTYSAVKGGFYARAYWNAEWTCEYIELNSLNTTTGEMVMEKKSSYYSVGAEKPAQYFNVYEELDEPGEWYYDKNTGNLYIYPVEGANENSKITMSFLNEAIIRLSKTSNVTFYGMDITGSNADYGVEVVNGKDNVFDKCNFHNFRLKAIMLDGADSRNNIIKNGELYNCGMGAVKMRGGNSATIEKSNDLVTNNKIHDFSLIRECYSPAVDMTHGGDDSSYDGWVEGCGNTVSYNEIYNSPHQAMALRGPYCTVEYNVFHDVCQNAQDMGAIYNGCNVLDLGHVVRYNHFYDIGDSKLGGNYSPCCYFADDGSLGGEVYGNTFGPGISNTEVIKIHGGTEFKVYNNVIIDAKSLVKGFQWGASRWYDYFWPNSEDGGKYDNARLSNSMKFCSTNKAAYVREFPWFENYINDYEAGCQNLGSKYWGKSYFYNNVMINIGVQQNSGSINTSAVTAQDNLNYKNTPGYLKDYEGGNYSLSDLGYSKIRETIADFPHLPYEAIGPVSVINRLPVAANVKVTRGTGSVLNGSYNYSDAEKDHEGKTVIKWYVAAEDKDSAYTEISGQTALSFTYDETYAGKYIKMEVTPVDVYGNEGTAVRSAAVLIASDKGGFERQIAAAESELNAAKAGSNLGEYPQTAIDDLKNAIEVAKSADVSTDEKLADAVEALSSAVNKFNGERVTSLAYKDGSGNITVPSDLDSMEITLENVTGDIVLKGTVLPKGTITAVINGKTVTVTVSEPVSLPGGEFRIGKLAETNAAEAGDVSLAFVLGKAGETYSPALKVTVSDIIGQNFMSVAEDGSMNDIEGLSVLEQKQVFDLTAGSEFVAFGTVVLSKDSTLSSLAVNGSEITLAAGTTEYQFRLPEGVTAAVITATATNKNATVTIPEVTKIPARNLEIVVTAQNGTKTVYKLTILPTVTSSKDDNSNNGSSNNGGTVSGSPYGNSGNNNFYSSETTSPNIDAENFCFDDMINHWARTDVMKMYKAGYVSGVTERLFEPDRNITRAEFAAIMARALNLTDRAADYKDVESTDWYAGYVGACTYVGIISGYDGMFRPNDNITREEMAVMIVNAYSYLEKGGATGGIEQFSDKNEIADWAKTSVDIAATVGLISGMGDGTFGPKANATRAQAASLISRLVK